MIVIDPAHLSDVDFNISAITAVPRTHGDGTKQGYTDMGRPDHGLCLVRRGSIVYIDSENRSVTASVGDVVYLPKGKRYTAFFQGEEDGEADVLVNFMLSDVLGRGLSLSDDIFRVAEAAEEALAALFARIAACCSGAGGVMESKRLMFEVMERLVAGQDGREDVRTVEDCVSYINERYAEIDGVAQLARMCGLGETAFRRRFRESVGMSPVHYINAVKVERACRMLRSSEVTVQEVCQRLGFYDVAYFHKVFKRYTGKTPGEYSRG